MEGGHGQGSWDEEDMIQQMLGPFLFNRCEI